MVIKSYTVWCWDKEFQFRMGQTFKSKQEAQSFIKALSPFQYIAQICNYKIHDEDIV